eukprot:7657650-Pyramimonas_sp.AAC.2
MRPASDWESSWESFGLRVQGPMLQRRKRVHSQRTLKRGRFTPRTYGPTLRFAKPHRGASGSHTLAGIYP